MARRKRRRPELEREGQIRCRYCGGFYNPSLPECPNCGHQTEENQSYTTDWRHISPEECAGGFGGADHMIRRAASLAGRWAGGTLCGGLYRRRHPWDGLVFQRGQQHPADGGQ